MLFDPVEYFLQKNINISQYKTKYYRRYLFNDYF